MSDEQFVFLWELLCTLEEKEYSDCLAMPEGPSRYAEFLRRNHRLRSARLVESGFNPSRDPRTAYERFCSEQ